MSFIHKYEKRKEQRERDESQIYHVCSKFGCGRRLSLIEQLAGNKCTGCMGGMKEDYTKRVKMDCGGKGFVAQAKKNLGV